VRISRRALVHVSFREPDASEFRLIGYELICRSPKPSFAARLESLLRSRNTITRLGTFLIIARVNVQKHLKSHFILVPFGKLLEKRAMSIEDISELGIACLVDHL
jgi:hypothetical protein